MIFTLFDLVQKLSRGIPVRVGTLGGVVQRAAPVLQPFKVDDGLFKHIFFTHSHSLLFLQFTRHGVALVDDVAVLDVLT
jgi:hypothetical protein